MKNIIKVLIAIVGIVLVFTACHKEGDLPFYKAGNVTVLTGSATTVNAAVADSSKTALTLNWTWPNYATDSINQKFIVQIDSAGKNFVKPVTRVLKGVLSTSFTAKELNTIVFGFGDVSAPYSLEMRVISSYANNNEQYLSNNVMVSVTPYFIPLTLSLNPSGPLTLVVANAASNAVTFTWNATAFGNLPLNYAIQIDKADGTFASPNVITYGTALTGGITVNDLNNAAINAGISPNETGDLSIRAIAYQGTNFANSLPSNVVKLKVTPYLSTLTWYLPGDYVTDSYPGTTFLNWDPVNSPQIRSLASAPTNLEGYVYMANSSNNWKFASKPNWDGPNYANNDADGVLKPGILDPNAKNNINSPKGYYKINANVATFTYTAVATTWGIIGDASPNAWDDETALTYDPASSTWKGGMHMTVGAFKFRANHSWDYNYGSDLADGILSAGGGNIPIALAADYFFTLDLSHPNAYTYSANRWGLIGSATAGGWDSDQNLIWDAANKVLKITTDLVAGEIKFRANDAWDLALGGTVDALTTSGGNIAIAAAGNYTITLDLSKATYTCVIKKN